jgi:hypothetical protein
VWEGEELQATNRLRLDGGVGAWALGSSALVGVRSGAVQRGRWLARRMHRILVAVDL